MKTKEKFLKYIYEMSNIGLIHYDEFNLIKKRIELNPNLRDKSFIEMERGLKEK